MTRRWPGPDGLLLIALDLVAIGTWLLRGRPDLGASIALAIAGTACWLALTRSARRGPDPGRAPATPRPVVVIPTHDNAGTVADVVRRALAVHPAVWVVDDGSTDASGDLARAAGATVWTHPTNRGKGAALDTAIARAHEAGFTHVVALDADGQHFPEDIGAFLEAVHDRPEAIVCGVRDFAHAPAGAAWARRNSNLWVWVETGRRLGDTQSGFRAYPVGAVRALNLPPSRYEWEVEVLTRALWHGVPIRDIACRVYYPPADARVSSYRKVRDTLRMIWINAQLVAERVLWPPRWFLRAPREGWRGQHRGNVLGWRFVIGLMRVFGRRAGHVVVTPLALFYWLFATTPRAGLDAYLRRRFPEASAARRSLHALRVMTEFAHSLIDRFALLVHGPDVFEVDRTGLDALREVLYREDQGVVLLSAHLGDPELAAALLSGSSDRSVHVVMASDPDDPYQRLLREHMGERAPSIVSLRDGAQPASMAVLRALRAGGVVALKVDRLVGDRVVVVPFLGGPIPLPAGPLMLAALSGAPTVLIGCFREGGRYRVVATEPRTYAFTSRQARQDDLERWATELAEVLEQWTARYPWQWYNFHDLWAETGRIKPG